MADSKGPATGPSEMSVDTELVRQLAEMLIARLGGREAGELQTILPVRQVPRATHGPAN